MGADQVGIKFVQQYFEALSARPELLHAFYAPDSTYSCGHCEGDQERDQAVKGLDNIRAKILEQSFQDCIVNIFTIDVHAVKDNGVLVMVYGALMRDAAKCRFVHTFYLAAETVNERYFISNAMFRALDDTFPLVPPPAASPAQEEPAAAAPPSPAEAEPEETVAEEAAPVVEDSPKEAASNEAASAPAAAPQSYAAMAARQPQPQSQQPQAPRGSKAKERKKQEQTPDKAPPQSSGADARTLFVKSSKEAPLVDESVMELLRPHGAVKYTQARNHAYVEFSSAAAAQKLLKAEPLQFGGFPLIAEAKRASKPAKRAPGSGRGPRTNPRRGGRGRDRQ